MDLSRNILFSAAMHGLLAMALIALVGKGAGIRARPPVVHVTIVSDAGQAAPGAGPKPKTGVPVRPVTRKEVSRLSPSMPPASRPAPISRDVPVAAAGPAGKGDGASPAAATSREQGISIITGTAGGSAAPSHGASSAGGQQPGRATAGAGRADAVQLIRSAIERAREYPSVARRRGTQGTATVSFAVNGRGLPEDIRVVRSSGSEVLDAAARETILRAAPFPAIGGVIEVPIVFRLER